MVNSIAECLTLHCTFNTVLGVIDTTINACGVNPKSTHAGGGSMYQGVPVGISTCVLSLSTNLVATLLVGYKAWYGVMHAERDVTGVLITTLCRQWRRNFKGYLVSGSQVEKLLVLLIESGAAYCAIWVISLRITQSMQLLGILTSTILIRELLSPSRLFTTMNGTRLQSRHPLHK